MSQPLKPLRILYFGIFDENFSRNGHYIKGLRENGVEVTLCTDKSRGIFKYIKLFKKHWNIRESYDAMIVGYPGYIIVPFARLITRKPVFFDALSSFYEAQIISRNAYKGNPLRIPYVRFVDWISTRCATKVLVETEKQKEYFVKQLGVSADKLVVSYTGTDSVFEYKEGGKKFETFTVLFRGRITKEAGVAHVLKAAQILESMVAQSQAPKIDILIIGFGWGEAIEEFNALMKDLALTNVRHISTQIPQDQLIHLMSQCHVSLGQFAANERLERTIPHKAFESLALKLPYITARARGVEEILTNDSCVFVEPADPAAIAEAIIKLESDESLRMKLAENAYTLYKTRFTPYEIVQPIIASVKHI